MRPWWMIALLVVACQPKPPTAADRRDQQRLEANRALAAWVPHGAEPYDSIPRRYRTWWLSIRTCYKRVYGVASPATFDTFHWQKVPDFFGVTAFRCPSGFCDGWYGDSTTYIARGWMRDRVIVQHEMLHRLIGVPGHPPVFTLCKVL